MISRSVPTSLPTAEAMAIPSRGSLMADIAAGA